MNARQFGEPYAVRQNRGNEVRVSQESQGEAHDFFQVCGGRSMAIRVLLRARDVTLLPESRPAAALEAVPERQFALGVGADGYSLEFDGRRASVLIEDMRHLFTRVLDGTPVEWRYSSNSEVRTVFEPLARILPCLNTTPAYQLFLAGFHIADTIGLLTSPTIHETGIIASFRYLVGPLVWPYGKKGRLFFLPEQTVTPQVATELIANGKLFSATILTEGWKPTEPIEVKLFIPYATPIGFNTHVGPETEDAWRKIGEMLRRLGGGGLS